MATRTPMQIDSWDPAWWIKEWEDSLKEPESFLFVRSIRNVAQYLSVVFLKAGHAYDLSLLTTLRDLLRSQKLEKKLITKCDRNIIRDINSIGSTSRLDLTALAQFLSRLVAICQSDAFLEVLKNEFVKNIINPTNQSTKNRKIITNLLIRCLLDRFSPEFLKETASTSFLGSVLRHNRLTLQNALVSNNELSNLLEIVGRNTVTAIGNNSAGVVLDDKFFQNLFMNKVAWKRTIEYSLVELRVDLLNSEAELDQILDASPEERPVKMIGNPKLRAATDRFFQHFVDIVADIITNTLLNPPLISSSQRSDIVLNDYSQACSRIMNSAVPRSDRSTNPYSGVVNEALGSAVHRWLSDIFSENMPNKPDSSIISQVIIESLTDYLAQIDNQSFAKVGDGLFRFELTRKMITRLEQEARLMVTNVLSDLQPYSDKCTTPEELKKLFEMHVEKIFSMEISSYYVSDWLHVFNPAEARAMIDDLFTVFLSPEKTWIVFHEVSHLDCNGKKFEIDGVELFDSRKWDYGEGVAFDLARFRGATREEFQTESLVYQTYDSGKSVIKWIRGSARAKAKVRARDDRMAIRIARMQTHKAVSTLVFANSEKQFGFRPVIPLEALVTDENLKPDYTRAESVDTGITLKIDEEQLKITNFYDELMRTANPEVKTSLERALSWFYKARWEDVEHAKFASYWIALEQLVTKGSKVKDAIIEFIPKITTNWRRGGDWPYSLNYQLSIIVRAIEQDSAAHAKIKQISQMNGFEKDYGIIMQNLAMLQKILKRSPALQNLNQVKGFTNGRAWRLLSMEVKARREHEKFLIALAYQKRNELFHEGLSYSQELIFYNSKLEGIVYRTLSSLLEAHPSSTDMRAVVQQIEQPLPIA